MPNIYLKDEPYKEIILLGEDPTKFVHEAVINALQKRKEKKE